MQDIHDIKSPIETPLITQNLFHRFWVFLGIILLLAVMFLIYYFWERSKRKRSRLKVTRKKESGKKEIDYSALARQKLIEIKKYIKQGDFKTFHIKASKLVREYLSRQYQDNFSDMTAREILGKSSIPREKHEKLRKFFSKSDMVKFAKLEDNREEAENIYFLIESLFE